MMQHAQSQDARVAVGADARTQADAQTPSRELVQDIQLVTGEGATQTNEQAANSVLSAFARANASLDGAAESLPAFVFPAGGGLLIFVGAALLTRGVLAKRQALRAMDPRVRALLALRRVMGKKLDISKEPSDAGDALGAAALAAMRGG